MSTPQPRETRITWYMNGKNEVLDLDKDTIVIGRSQNCDIIIRDDRTSRQHAKFMYDNGIWYAVDMGAANGTMVNERRIVKTELKDGDTVTVGSVRLRFQLRKSQTGTEPRVVFKEERTHRNYTHQINIEELRSLIGGATTGKKEIAGTPSVATWVIPVFSQAAQALISVVGTEDLLNKVMDLVFTHMPVERGVIGLLDEKTSDLIPIVMRSKDSNPHETIAISRSIANEAIVAKSSVLIDDTQQDERFSQEESILQMNIRAAMCSPIVNEGAVKGVIYVDSQAKLKPYSKDHLNVLGTLAMLTAVGIEQIRLRENIARDKLLRERLGRYMAPNLVENILKRGALQLEGDMVAETRELSVIFADLSGFTTMAEKLPPAQVANLLNTVFERLTDVIFAMGGTLDKYMGDAIMAFFGAPEIQPDHALRVVQAALKMQAELDKLNDEMNPEKRITMRIGINSGEVVVGDIGSPKRKDYTVIGDVVNIASRLESSVAKPGQIVIGARTYELVREVVECQDLGEVKLKGKSTDFRPYLVKHMRESATLGS